MADFFLFRLFIIFLTSLDDTSLKQIYFIIFVDFRNTVTIPIKRNNFREIKVFKSDFNTIGIE